MEAKKPSGVSAERKEKPRRWLPLPLAGKTEPLSRSELKDYREAQERHQQLDPDYAEGMASPRPTSRGGCLGASCPGLRYHDRQAVSCVAASRVLG